MAKTVKKKAPSPFGPIKLRLPFAAEDRAAMENVRIDGEVEAGWGGDALVMRAVLRAQAPVPRMRPIFPGELRFVADTPADIPALADIAVIDGRVDDDYLDNLPPFTGLIVIRPAGDDQLKQMKALPRLAAFGPAPGHAIYGPVRLDPLFLRQAVLDHTRLLSATFIVGKGKKVKIAPGKPDWQRHALHRFLAGAYAPAIRARGEKLGTDDADLAAMPEIDVAGDRSFSFMVALGTACDPKTGARRPADPQSPVPTKLFLRQNRAGLREDFDQQLPDHLVTALLLGDEDNARSEGALRGRLMALGFGDTGGAMLLEAVIREFQIAAKGAIVAKGKAGVSRQQLDGRGYRDLVAATNEQPYAGPISGMADLLTREMIGIWEAKGWRSPLLIVAHRSEILDAASQPAIADVWGRKEVRDNALRMFAADLTRLEPGQSLDETKLELIGFYAIYPPDNAAKTGGPSSLPPNAARRVALAELTPARMLGCDEADLIAALPPAADGPLTATISTFKVVRAVAEQECLGYLDQINAYDNAGLSFGPCHWAMAGAIKKPTGFTELGAFAAFLRMLEAQGEVGIDVFARQGLRATGAGQPGWTSGRAAFYAPLGFIDGCGHGRGMERSGPEDMVPSWRNFYRWVAIGRRHPTIGRAAWRMATLRLHSFLPAPIKGADLPVDPRLAPGAVPTIASVFTSELAVATLMRWHVKSPDGVIGPSDQGLRASKYVVAAYKNAAATVSNTNRAADPHAWEAELVKELRKQLVPFRAERDGLHGDLVCQFKELEFPKWIDQTRAPPVRSNQNTGAFHLDPRLRILSDQGRSFRLAGV